MVKIMENPIKWMIWGEKPIFFGNIHPLSGNQGFPYPSLQDEILSARLTLLRQFSLVWAEERHGSEEAGWCNSDGILRDYNP